MTSTLKALIVILLTSAPIFLLLSRTLGHIISNSVFSRVVKSWFIIVIFAFLLPDYWSFVFATVITLVVLGPYRPDDRIIYYFFLLCALPMLKGDIPGIIGLDYFFTFSYNRLLIFILLVPLLFRSNITSANKENRLFQLPSDLYVVLFTLLIFVLNFRDTTTTNALRMNFLVLVDLFFTYYIISRHIISLNQFNRVMVALFCTIIPVALVGILEPYFWWHLYNETFVQLSAKNDLVIYDARAGILRASSIFFSPIVYGYVLMISFGILLYLKPFLVWKKSYYIYIVIIITGILLSLSRGPWLGFVVLLVVYIWTGREKLKYYSRLLFVLLMTIPLISLTPAWEKFIQLLPFIGTTSSNTISYRQRLFDNAWIVIQKNPIFGSTTYLQTPEMESMRQGEGIIDIVNTYLAIGLNYGLVGVALFLLTFLILMFKTYRIMYKLPEEQVDMFRLGRVLISILAAILVTIATVSPIDFIPVFFWIFAASTAAYIYIARQIIYDKDTKSVNTNTNT